MNNERQQGAEIDSFEQHGADFWLENGPYRTLHHINPTRLSFIERYQSLSGKRILDIGCGGGLLSESMAQKGALVKGVDLSKAMIEAAKTHAAEQGLSIDYQCVSSADCVEKKEQYDIITCMEMLEHVVDPSVVIRDIYTLLNDNGYAFFSTLNRTITAFLGAIVAAEYLTRLVPIGTHQHDWFIKPAELVNMCEHAGLKVVALSGMDYHPLLKKANLSKNLSINYLLAVQKIN